MNNFLGLHVSIDCGDVLGTYQGKVKEINNEEQTLTLVSPYRNGIQSIVKQITLQ